MQTEILSLLSEMIEQQRGKCQRIANRINPRLTPDDLMNPFDWPEVGENPQFAWEDGLLAGLQAAHAAISAREHQTGDSTPAPPQTGRNDPDPELP